MRDESLAGFISRNTGLDRDQFLAKHPQPVLLTSMPTETELTAWSILMPLKKRARPKKPASGPLDKTISTRLRVIAEQTANPNVFYVGRSPECDIVLAPKSVSRRHAAFMRRPEDGIWLVKDLGSANGMLVNGQRLQGQQIAPLTRSPVSIDFGPDVQVHFMLPVDLFVYVSRFMDEEAATPIMPFPTSKASSSERLSTATPRPDDDFTREVGATLHDAEPGETQEELSVFGPAAPAPSSGKFGLSKTPPGALSSQIHPDVEKKLLKTIQTIAAVDTLVLSITARLGNDSRAMTIFSSEHSGRVVDAAEQLVRMGPLLQKVYVTLSVGNGRPIEVYAKDADGLEGGRR